MSEVDPYQLLDRAVIAARAGAELAVAAAGAGRWRSEHEIHKH